MNRASAVDADTKLIISYERMQRRSPPSAGYTARHLNMAGGLKKRRKRTIEGATTIEGVRMLWALISEPQWSNGGDGYKGLCISVNVADQARRELIIEYPYPTNSRGLPLSVPQRPPVRPALVETSIRQALEAGWDPASRGKAFVFHPSKNSD